jgi:riboflavin synthase
MFTGIVDETGNVEAVVPFEAGLRFTIRARAVLGDLSIGDSIAVDGVCLTVVERGADQFSVQAIATTLSRTTLGALRPADEVNLERALAYGQRMGGHLVQGHVDGLASVVNIRQQGDHVLMDLELPDDTAEVTVLHGSIAVHGVSLTVNALPARNIAQVALIPHTWDHTNLRKLRVGSAVNVEGDVLGRFVAHYLKRIGGPGV